MSQSVHQISQQAVKLINLTGKGTDKFSSQALGLFEAMAEAKAVDGDAAALAKVKRIEFARFMWASTVSEKGFREVVLIAARLKQSVNVNASFDQLPETYQLKISDAFKRMFDFVGKYKPLAESVA
ncbi:MAG: hypothetical protein IBX55_15970 [Methyloprofundus sp.]|nr:hypothetical protein [Methyloprofundus sp.]